ncbi:hypothetical protein [Peribacillus sp. SCS-37]|uniref:hypothetical protein n=1 Tax=Paraperibacillus esterisolvens TaxID=3115296 RepID=UPI0039061248
MAAFFTAAVVLIVLIFAIETGVGRWLNKDDQILNQITPDEKNYAENFEEDGHHNSRAL